MVDRSGHKNISVDRSGHKDHTHLETEQRVLLVSPALEEGALAPAGHQGAHGLHVALGQPHPTLQVTHQVPGGLERAEGG